MSREDNEWIKNLNPGDAEEYIRDSIKYKKALEKIVGLEGACSADDLIEIAQTALGFD